MRLTIARTTYSAIIVSGVFAALARQVFASTCPPSIVVEGPVSVTGPIAAILRQHGISVGPSACSLPVVRALVSGDSDSGVHLLRIQDRFGRSAEREISNAETAASLIESWVFEEDADLIAPRADLTAPEGTLQPPAVTPPSPSRVVGLLMGSAAISTASDDSTWYGGTIAGCLAVRALCVGVRARFGRSTGVANSIVAGDLTRIGLGAMGLAILVLRRGRFFVSPMLAVGPEWVHTVVTFQPVALSSTDVVLRGEGAGVAGFSIAGGWSLLAELGASGGPRLSTADRQGADVLLPLPPSWAFFAGLGVGFLR